MCPISAENLVPSPSLGKLVEAYFPFFTIYDQAIILAEALQPYIHSKEILHQEGREWRNGNNELKMEEKRAFIKIVQPSPKREIEVILSRLEERNPFTASGISFEKEKKVGKRIAHLLGL